MFKEISPYKFFFKGTGRRGAALESTSLAVNCVENPEITQRMMETQGFNNSDICHMGIIAP